MRVKNMTRAARLHRKALVLAIGLGFAGMSGVAFGQATTATIFGQAPVQSGETVLVTGGAGLHRTVPVGPDGRFKVTLPVGTYTVTLERNGNAIATRTGLQPAAGGAVFVNLQTSQANAEKLGAVTVSANAIPAIDVHSSSIKTTITAQQLEHLPIGRSAAAIAMLAPGVTMGAAADGFGPTGNPLLSFAGSSIVENAYYVDGMDTTAPLANLGGITLPYNSIQQEQVLIAGYGAKYGQSTGGVINQIGKSGTNTWHFGGRVLWQPKSLRATPHNVYYNNPLITSGDHAKGKLYRARAHNHRWQTTYDAYIGGPIIKNKLFFFLSGEWNKVKGNTVAPTTSHQEDFERVENPKYYMKINWNINQDNILAVTGVYNDHRVAGDVYTYNNGTHESGQFVSADQATAAAFRIWVANYTSYITNNLTLHAMYGKMDGDYSAVLPKYTGYDPSQPAIIHPELQDPAKTPTGAAGIISGNQFVNISSPLHHSEVTNERLNLQYVLGINTFELGMENVKTWDNDGGVVMTGPGYAWDYATSSLGTPIQGHPFVPAPPASAACPTADAPKQACVVTKYQYVTETSIHVKQRSLYFQDNLQLTPDLLLNLGIRRSTFENFNSNGQPYININGGSWAPRLGAVWNVYGDGSLKVFANAGRYYLAVPPGPGLRGAGSSLYRQQFYTYTSIDSNGIPHGLTKIGNPVFENGANGQPIDPKLAASTNLKAEYQDNFILGAQKTLGDGLVGGITLRYNKLGRVLDDWDVPPITKKALKKAGYDPDDFKTPFPDTVINPGETALIREQMKNGKYVVVPVTQQEMGVAIGAGIAGYPIGYPTPKRDYWSVELSLTHPWNGKWMGKIMYVLSHTYGNTEGGVQSNIGQDGPGSVDQTEQWDFPSLMTYAGGDQANDRRNVLKAFGIFKIAPNWMVSGNLLLEQGTPVNCLGYYGTQQIDPVGYAAAQGGAYHFCGGVPTPPGSTGRTPWLHILSLGVEYYPSFADHHLSFQLQVHNVFDEQKPIQEYSRFGQTSSPYPFYRMARGSNSHTALSAAQFGYETPRYVQFGITYNY